MEKDRDILRKDGIIRCTWHQWTRGMVHVSQAIINLEYCNG